LDPNARFLSAWHPHCSPSDGRRSQGVDIVFPFHLREEFVMKRTLSSLAMLVVLATPVLAQTSTSTTAPSPNTGSMNHMNDSTTTTGGTYDHDTNGSNTPSHTGGTSSDLPRTASPLPFVTFSGLLALGSGLWLSRRRRV
jgi:LPXTG-motif cell wall-anchored protein